MMVNTAVGFETFLREYNSNDNSLAEDSDDEAEGEIPEDDDEYEVELIVGKQTIDGVIMYLIRWKGCGEEDDEWQSADQLQHSPDLIKAFEARIHPAAAPVRKKATTRRGVSKIHQLMYELSKFVCVQEGKGMKNDQKGQAFMISVRRYERGFELHAKP